MSSPNPYAPPKAPVADAEDLIVGGHAVLATRGERLGAVLLDGVIALVWTVPLMIYLGIWDYAFHHQRVPYARSALLTVLGFLLFTLVNCWFLHTNGQTLGKKIVGIRIARLDDTVPDLGRVVLLRYAPMSLASLVPGIGGLFNLVDVLMIFGNERRCLHDRIASTIVVRARSVAI